MKVLSLAWVGTRTERFEQMAEFYDKVLGLSPTSEKEDFLAYKLPSGDVVELFGPGDSEHDHFVTGPVVGFLVEDFERAIAEMRAAGVEFLGDPVVDDPSGLSWAHFRAPDGHVYEVTANPSHPAQDNRGTPPT